MARDRGYMAALPVWFGIDLERIDSVGLGVPGHIRNN